MNVRAAIRTLSLAVLLSAAASPRPAVAAAPLPVTVWRQAGVLHAAADLGPVLPRELPERLGNGLRNVVAVFVAVVPVGGEAPTAAWARVIDVTFDVWEETWIVVVRDPRIPAGSRRPVADAEQLRRLLATAAEADLGPADALPDGPFTVDVRIDVNPVSAELLARTRQHLAGAGGPGRTSRSVLGAVAGLLLREPEEDGDVLSFRSAPMGADAVVAR